MFVIGYELGQTMNLVIGCVYDDDGKGTKDVMCSALFNHTQNRSACSVPRQRYWIIAYYAIVRLQVDQCGWRVAASSTSRVHSLNCSENEKFSTAVVVVSAQI
jgi:hypothetical protein